MHTTLPALCVVDVLVSGFCLCLSFVGVPLSLVEGVSLLSVFTPLSLGLHVWSPSPLVSVSFCSALRILLP